MTTTTRRQKRRECGQTVKRSNGQTVNAVKRSMRSNGQCGQTVNAVKRSNGQCGQTVNAVKRSMRSNGQTVKPDGKNGVNAVKKRAVVVS
jgi:hypothetical protein